MLAQSRRHWKLAFSLIALVLVPAVALGAGGRGGRPGGDDHGEPDDHADNPSAETPARRQIQHIVWIMMENRSFDHLLGWHPTADGEQRGLSYPDDSGTLHTTFPLAPEYMGCGHPDPDHSWEGGREQLNGGLMNGFLRSGDNDEYAIGFYTQTDQPFLAALARNYTTLDRYFSSILAETYPNKMFQHAAQTDRLRNTLTPSTLPTIWDKLAAKGVRARYYFSDFSFLALWGPKYASISRPYSQFLADAAAGQLPSVSVVEPRFFDERRGTNNSYHPHGDIRAGDAFLARTLRAITSSPNWPQTIVIVTFDEWGGFFDHVAPPRATAPNRVDQDIVGGKTLLGFRVPTIVVSPFSKGNSANPRVVSDVYDHTSVLKLIEWRWRLTPLTARDASIDVGNILSALDGGSFDPRVPLLPLPNAPAITPCPLPLAGEDAPWDALQAPTTLAGE